MLQSRLLVAQTVASLLLLALAIGGLFWVRVLDPEVFLHLRTGKIIWETGSIPHRDVFSSNALGREWVNHEWLWQGLTYWTYQNGKWVALSWLRLLFVVGTVAALVAASKCRGASFWAVTTGVLFGIGPLASFAEIHPQIASLLLFSITLLLLEWGRRRPLLLFVLPVVFALWSNLHAAVLIGFLPVGFSLVAAMWKRWRQGGDDPAHHLRWLVIAAMLCLLATISNPHGYRVHAFPLKVVGHGISSSQLFAWSPPDFSRLFLPFWIYVVVVVVLVGWMWKSLRAADWALFLSLLLAALANRRQIPFFVLGAVPVIAVALQRLTISLPRRLAALALATTLALFSMWAYAAAGRTHGTGIAKGHFPEDAATRLGAIVTEGAVLNNSNDGGYLLWRLWPGWLITMDSRADVYGPETVNQHQKVWTGQPGWQETLRSWNVQAVLGRFETTRALPDHNLYHELAGSLDWAPVHWDATSILYLRRGRALEASDHKAYRRLRPGLHWREIAALQKTPEEWDALGADLRRSLSDYPDNWRALEFERRWHANEARPASTIP